MNNILTVRFSKRLLLVGLVLLLVGFVLFIWNDWSFNTSNKLQSEKVAQFGDFVGGLIGSIWALAGVVLFYVALTEQRKDFATNREVLNAQTEALKQQIREFGLQREELSETRKVFTNQSVTLMKQQFESTFFNLLNLHHSIVNSIDVISYEKKPIHSVKNYLEQMSSSGDRVTTTGRDSFVKFKEDLENTYKNITDKNESELDEFDKVNAAYNYFYERHQSDLGHYFRNLYHIFKFIHNSDIPEKTRYTSLARAQLSNDELFLLFYNSISTNGKKKFKPLVEEYHLLKNLNSSTIINWDLHSKYYSKCAFKNVC